MRSDLHRRALPSDPPIAPLTLGSESWPAIVAAPDSPIRDWPALLGALRHGLAARGRLFVVVPPGSAPASSTARSDAMAALYETGYCVVREEVVALTAPAGDGDGAPSSTPGEALLIEARTDEHRVRSYREGDEAAILRLFEGSFSPPRGENYWRWKFRDNPYGSLAISCAFAPKGDLVAHYAAYPIRFRRSLSGGGETILCHQVGDTMTDRRYRHVGRGRTSLLARTARHFYARHCEDRVAFNYGFNTGNIQRFSQLFVRARKVWDIELRTCRTTDLRLTAPRRFRPYRVTRVQRVDAAFDDLFERVAPRYGLLVERLRPYLEWRYLRCPDREYHLLRVDRGKLLVGWGVFRPDGDRLLWGDALFDPDHPGAVSALLDLASRIEQPTAEREHRVEAWFSPHPSWWNERLRALGFVTAPEPQNLGMVYVPFLESPDDELATGYYLAMGDSDLF